MRTALIAALATLGLAGCEDKPAAPVPTLDRTDAGTAVREGAAEIRAKLARSRERLAALKLEREAAVAALAKAITDKEIADAKKHLDEIEDKIKQGGGDDDGDPMGSGSGTGRILKICPENPLGCPD